MTGLSARNGLFVLCLGVLVGMPSGIQASCCHANNSEPLWRQVAPTAIKVALIVGGAYAVYDIFLGNGKTRKLIKSTKDSIEKRLGIIETKVDQTHEEIQDLRAQIATLSARISELSTEQQRMNTHQKTIAEKITDLFKIFKRPTR